MANAKLLRQSQNESVRRKCDRHDENSLHEKAVNPVTTYAVDISKVSYSAFIPGGAKKMSRTFARIIQLRGRNESVQKHTFNDQTSPNMCGNFRLKHFCISRDTNINSVTRHKAIFASGSFAFLLVRRLRQNVTVGRITS